MAVASMDRPAKPAIWTTGIVSQAMRDAVAKLNPRSLARNPIIFIVEVGAALTTAIAIRDIARGEAGSLLSFDVQIALWLWFTVLFANFAEAIAEGRGKAQADTLRKTRTDANATRETASGATELVPASLLRKGDIVRVQANEVIPGDGDVISGVAFVSEAAITGNRRRCSKSREQTSAAPSPAVPPSSVTRSASRSARTRANRSSTA